MIVTARDPGGLVDNQAIAVTVTAVVNVPPVITSNGGGATAAISIAENTTAVTTVTATDANPGQTITYSISGGADAAKFSINATTGVLAFLAAPDFEAPTDVGANNVFDVIVSARDNLNAVDTQAIAVTVTNVNGVNLTGTTAKDTQTGTNENDTISGGSGNDTINGLGGPDTLRGDAGNDTINGGDVNDTITGGSGVDSMTGGAGSDRFVFTANSDTGTTGTTRDVITDFQQGLDKIDLSAIDANQSIRQPGDQAFTLLTTAGANFTALGQLRYSYTTINGVQHTIIEGNDVGTNGADFAIDLVGRYTLTATDFIL